MTNEETSYPIKKDNKNVKVASTLISPFFVQN